MSNDLVGSTTYAALNKQMINADMHIGDTAAEVESAYQAGKSSLTKKIILSILSVLTGVVGIGWAIAHAVREHNHEKAIGRLTQGTRNFYDALKELKQSDGRDEFDREVEMCGEKVRIVRNAGETNARIRFEDGEEQEIKNLDTVLYQIERDVMKHSEVFPREFVVDILNQYRDTIAAGPTTRDGLWQDINQVHAQANRYIEEGTLGTNLFKLQASAGALSESRQAPLTVAKNRASELLSDLFSTRLNMSPDEVKYIDLGLGIQLADNVMAGTLTTPEAVRAFVNRNAAGSHFTTIESAKVFGQFEQAEAAEKKHEAQRGEQPPATSSVSFKEGYYQPKPNPALPVGKEKEVHDFVADMIASNYAVSHDTSHKANAMLDKDGKVAASGERLRNLFAANKQIVGELMANRAAVLAGATDQSLLATVDPGIRAELEKQLDALNERFEAMHAKDIAAREELINEIKEAEQPDSGVSKIRLQSLKNRLSSLEDRINDPVAGRRAYVDLALVDVGRSEAKIERIFGTRNIDEITDTDLDQMGASEAGKQNDDLQEMLKAKHEKDPDNYAGIYMSEIRDELVLGADSFADCEKKIDEGVRKGCEQLQAQVNALIEGVFPEQAPVPTMTVGDIQNATFKDIIGNAAQDGQMQLVKTALQHYFADMPDMDKRAMVAAGTRFGKAGISRGAQLGAILKGAGPVMQKMLQGLDPSMFSDPDFKLALGDMKDKLAPISQRAVQAYLYDIVRQSNGSITGIEVEKALGAASVAQALKCKIHNADGTTVDCVVKILRPEAAQRARREEAVFQAAAREVGNGMEKTFAGQFASIMEELDLRTEAENVKLGNQVYDFRKSTYGDEGKLVTKLHYSSFNNVHAMKLVDGIEPSTNVMVLEQVPGTTLENYLKDTGEESQRIAQETKAQIASRGPENAPMLALEGADKLTNLYNDAKAKYDALVNLSYMWTNEGLFADGFYHGDVHKGNVMVDVGWKPDADPANPYKGITLIDFGNASHLNNEQKTNVVRVVAGTAVGDAELFAKGFRAMLSEESRAAFDAAGQFLKDKLAAIFAKGTVNDTASRLAAALKLMQREHQIEVPGEIHNFLESQRRLQVALDEAGATVKAIAAEREALVKPYLDQLAPDDKTRMETAVKDAAKYEKNKKTMVQCLTDVVKQNVCAALNSIGLKAGAECFQKIEAELNPKNAQPSAENEADSQIPLSMNPAALSA